MASAGERSGELPGLWSLATAIETRVPVVIVSGCYGLLIAEECIG